MAPIAQVDGHMQRDYWYDAARSLGRLADPETIGRTAAERTLRRLGARPVPTQQVPVVFDPQTAATLFSHLAGAICGGALYRRVSFLLDKLGSEIASPLVTVVDDGRMPRGLAPRPVDAEGMAPRRNLMVERGTLRSYLLDGYAAASVAADTSCGRARSATPGASPTNSTWRKGAHTPTGIIASVERGFAPACRASASTNHRRVSAARAASDRERRPAPGRGVMHRRQPAAG